MRTVFGQQAGQVRKPGNITVFGSPNEEMKEIIGRRNPVYETYIDGFYR
jgi:hypothetical protein